MQMFQDLKIIDIKILVFIFYSALFFARNFMSISFYYFIIENHLDLTDSRSSAFVNSLADQ